MPKPSGRALALLAALLLAAGCRPGEPARLDAADPIDAAPIKDVIAAEAPRLMAIPGVVGVYEGETRRHRRVIRIMVERRTSVLEAQLPKQLGGWPVEVEETGVIRPMNPDD